MNPLLAALLQAGLIDRDTADRMNRQLDPDAAREWAEAQLLQAAQRGLTGQQGRLLALVQSTNGRPLNGQLDRFWRAEDALLWDAMQDDLAEIALERAAMASVAVTPDTFSLINQSVIDYVQDRYTNADITAVGSIPNLNLTSRTRFGQIFTEWQRGELEAAGLADGLPQLIRATANIFGPTRAEAIAVTETTRLFVDARRLIEDANGNVEGYRWRTARDEIVARCPICGPMHGQVRRKGQMYIHPTLGPIDIPGHTRCRCDEQAETIATLAIPLDAEDRVFA